MKIANIVGYMLGNSNHVMARGDQWCDAGEQVYICTNKDVAKAILESSQIEMGNIIWTTIYRVHANDINIDAYTDLRNLAWTKEGNKIIVDRPVLYRSVQKMSEQHLLQNAAQIRPDYFKLVKGAQRGKRK
ncbi:MAG: hypothetical protein J6R52_02380 [Alphaproteobacteria bacterium]|nr:hypothetical protein [Alphaproteobacteria bacterium]